MIIVTDVLGNFADKKNHFHDYDIDVVKLEQWESSKSRIKKVSQKGQDIAISLDRGKHLHNQDILYIDDAGKKLVMVNIQLKNVLKITLPSDIEQHTLFKLGHALGNQHWPAVFRENHIYVPLYVDEKIMRSMLKTHHFNDIDIEFIEGEQLRNCLEASEMRLLFSGDDTTAHKHH